MKALRAVVGIVAVVAILWAAFHTVSKLKAGKALNAANRLFEDAQSAEDFAAAQTAYEAALKQGGPAQAKHLAKVGVACCKAHIAYFNARGKGTLAKHREAIERMKDVKELGGDPDGIWAKRIELFEREAEAKLGPMPEEMRRRLAAFDTKGFAATREDLEALYRWGPRWREDGVYQDDAERKALLSKTRDVLLANYTARFESALKAAQAAAGQKSKEALEAKVPILGALRQVGRFDKARADGYRTKHASIIAEAVEAQKLLAPPE